MNRNWPVFTNCWPKLLPTRASSRKEGVAQFFETVSSYEQIVSLDLEAKRAEVEAESAKSEARVSTIDLVKKLLSQGVRAQDLPHWQGVLNKAGVTAKELSG